jgi:SAM-dependent methyltransferase
MAAGPSGARTKDMPKENQAIEGFFCPAKIFMEDLKAKKSSRPSKRKSTTQTPIGIFDWLAPHSDRLDPILDPTRFAVYSVILDVLNALDPAPSRLLDLGCGTGFLDQQILELLPESRITALDGSLAMLQAAKINLQDFEDRITLVKSDFRDPWEETLPDPVDTVVQYASLHHLSHDSLREVFARIASALRPGGWFINADFLDQRLPQPVARIQDFIADFRSQSARLDLGDDIALLEEFEKLQHASRESGNFDESPALAEQQIAWMIEAGFEFASRIYQDWQVSVFIARKPE